MYIKKIFNISIAMWEQCFSTWVSVCVALHACDVPVCEALHRLSVISPCTCCSRKGCVPAL